LTLIADILRATFILSVVTLGIDVLIVIEKHQM
jgi:hypothetical protein